MAVGFPKRPNPYGPPPIFDPETQEPYGYEVPQAPTVPPTQQPYMGFLDVAGVDGVGQQGEEFQQEPPQLIEPLAQQDQPAVGAMPTSGEEYPSEASIERRMKLAKTLMENQQEVNHPMQAVANAVSKIGGAWMERKAIEEQERANKRYYEALRGSMTGEGDLEQKAIRMTQSPDPRVVEMGYELWLKIEVAKYGGRGQRKPPATRTYERGGEKVTEQWNEDTQQFEPLATAPRYREGEGPGGGRSQQGGMFNIPGVGVRPGEFIPGTGYGYRDSQTGQFVPLPPDATPVTPGAAAQMMNITQYNKLRRDLATEDLGLKRLKNYYDTSGRLNQGGERMVDRAMLNIKTFFGSNEAMTDEQWALADADAQMNAIRGALRLDIAGPGNPSNYDMEMILAALGGRPISALQNREVVRDIIARLYSNKMMTRNELRDQVDEQATLRGKPKWGSELPEALGDEAPQPVAVPKGLPPPDKRPKGTRVTRGGKTFEWSGTGWREVR